MQGRGSRGPGLRRAVIDSKPEAMAAPVCCVALKGILSLFWFVGRHCFNMTLIDHITFQMCCKYITHVVKSFLVWFLFM